MKRIGLLLFLLMCIIESYSEDIPISYMGMMPGESDRHLCEFVLKRANIVYETSNSGTIFIDDFGLKYLNVNKYDFEDSDYGLPYNYIALYFNGDKLYCIIFGMKCSKEDKIDVKEIMTTRIEEMASKHRWKQRAIKTDREIRAFEDFDICFYLEENPISYAYVMKEGEASTKYKIENNW